MKLQKLISGAALALVMTACSSDEPAITPNNPVNFEGTGYVSVSINLPTTKANSRAINDDFENGEDYEYFVKDAVLVLFSGSDETSATFKGAYEVNVSDGNVNEKPNNNVTTQFSDVVKIENVTINETTHLYALVMANYGDVASVVGTKLAVNGINFSGTFADLGEKLTSEKLYRIDETSNEPTYFFMTNTPQVNVPGEDTPVATYKLTTLAEIDGKKVYASETEAKEAKEGVAEIFIERAVAKTTLSAKNVTAKIGDTDLQLVAGSLQWSLDNTEPTSYIVRNMEGHADYMTLNTKDAEGATKYRFVGFNKFKTDFTAYRAYWCKDPNYDNDNRTYNSHVNFVEPGTLYCHENTFDVDHQTYNQTTRVVVKAQFTLGEGKNDFYTVGDNKSVIYDAQSKAQSLAEEFIMKDSGLYDAIVKALKEVKEEGEDINVKTTDIVTVNWTDKVNDKGAYTVASLSYEYDKTTLDVKFDDEEALIEAANKVFPVYFYNNGVSYYDIRVKHFGDDYTPWTPVNGDDVETVYGTDKAAAAAKYLGRYGMVRNNWYDINIKSISNLGSPVVPNGDIEISDDNKDEEQWIKFTINIMSWAKRTQNVDF